MSACQYKNVISIQYEIDMATFLSILDPLILEYFRECCQGNTDPYSFFWFLKQNLYL